jgi:hypothetical protein
MRKRGAIGEGIVTLYRLLVITFIAFVILGVSSVFYSHYIDVRDAEAVIMTRQVVDCIAPEGVVDLVSLGIAEGELLSYCGYSDLEMERFFVRAVVSVEGEKVGEFSQGDSGALWVLEMFDSGELEEGIRKYKPGYSKRDFFVGVINEGLEKDGNLEVEVLVSDEF